MPQYSPLVAAAWWDAFNLMLGALPATGTPVLRIRYEDVIRDPAAALRSILAPTGLELRGGWDAFLTPDGAVLGASHSVAGNPMRFRTGAIALRPDDEWRTHLPLSQRRLVTATTAPLLGAYGYTRGRSGRR